MLIACCHACEVVTHSDSNLDLGPDLGVMEVSVGVGALAGSTVMLLTLPWHAPGQS